MAMSRSFCLVSVFTATVITIFYDLVNAYDGVSRASRVMDVYRQMACFGGGHLLDNLTKHRTAIELTVGVLVLWVSAFICERNASPPFSVPGPHGAKEGLRT